jgi:hypothetical protein
MAMVTVIISTNLAFFRNRTWERLIVNIGIRRLLPEVLQAPMNSLCSFSDRRR